MAPAQLRAAARAWAAGASSGQGRGNVEPDDGLGRGGVEAGKD
jgi:hypothetical protein